MKRGDIVGLIVSNVNVMGEVTKIIPLYIGKHNSKESYLYLVTIVPLNCKLWFKNTFLKEELTLVYEM